MPDYKYGWDAESDRRLHEFWVHERPWEDKEENEDD